MVRSETESFKSPRDDFLSGKTVHFERMVTALDSLEKGFAILQALFRKMLGMLCSYRPSYGVCVGSCIPISYGKLIYLTYINIVVLFLML